MDPLDPMVPVILVVLSLLKGLARLVILLLLTAPVFPVSPVIHLDLVVLLPPAHRVALLCQKAPVGLLVPQDQMDPADLVDLCIHLAPCHLMAPWVPSCLMTHRWT